MHADLQRREDCGHGRQRGARPAQRKPPSEMWSCSGAARFVGDVPWHTSVEGPEAGGPVVGAELGEGGGDGAGGAGDRRRRASAARSLDWTWSDSASQQDDPLARLCSPALKFLDEGPRAVPPASIAERARRGVRA